MASPPYAHTLPERPQEEWEPLFTPFGDAADECQRESCQKCQRLEPDHGHSNSQRCRPSQEGRGLKPTAAPASPAPNRRPSQEGRGLIHAGKRQVGDSKEIEAAMMDFGGSGEVTAAASESLESSRGLDLHDALDFRDGEPHALELELR
jgi:hypothetical protein